MRRMGTLLASMRSRTLMERLFMKMKKKWSLSLNVSRRKL
jgi:hypothetical protein